MLVRSSYNFNVRFIFCKKYRYIYVYFVASFSYFNGTDSVYVCILTRQNNEVRANVKMFVHIRNILQYMSNFMIKMLLR